MTNPLDANYLKSVGGAGNDLGRVDYAVPRTLWHPSQSQFGYGSTDYPDYGLRLPSDKDITLPAMNTILGDESKELW